MVSIKPYIGNQKKKMFTCVCVGNGFVGDEIGGFGTWGGIDCVLWTGGYWYG